jgi:hypothetical protein
MSTLQLDPVFENPASTLVVAFSEKGERLRGEGRGALGRDKLTSSLSYGIESLITECLAKVESGEAR